MEVVDMLLLSRPCMPAKSDLANPRAPTNFIYVRMARKANEEL